MINPETLHLTADDAAGQRLDAWLAQALPHHSRSSIRRRIEAGDVTVTGKKILKGSHTLSGGESITITIPPPASALPEAEAIPLDVIFEDEHLVVINKPPGMVVHPGKGNMEGTLVNALLHHCPDIHGVGGVRRPGIVHRLDKGTSGLLLVAKDDPSHVALSAALKRREIHRRYDALAWGAQWDDIATIDAPIGRDPKNRLRMAVVRWGRTACTHGEVIAAAPLLAHLRLRLETGRTHQIRVHLAHVTHPILGDELYGGSSADWVNRLQRGSSVQGAVVRRITRPMLHARSLEFVHPITGETHHFEIEPPDDFQAVKAALIS